MMRRGQETTRPKMTNGSSDLFSIPGDEFTELVWENGQILMQNQSNKGRKSSCVSSGFSARYGTVQEKESREKVGSEYPPSRHSANNGVNAQDDDVVSWISYPIDEIFPSETLQNDYCAEFLNEFSAFDVNPLSTHRSNVAGTGRTAGLGQEARSSNNVEHGHVAKLPNWSSLGSSRIRASHLQQSQASALNSKLTVVDIRSSDDKVAQEPQCQDVMDRKFQNQELASSKQMQQQGGMGTLMNFSHFVRPAALAKVGLHNAAGPQSIVKALTPSRNPVTLTPVESTRGSKNANKVPGQSGSGPHRLEFGSAVKTLQGSNFVEFSNKISAGDTLRNNTEKHTKLLDDLPSSSFAASVALCRHDIRKDPEAVIPSSSVCSENITGAASNEPNHGEKRKEYDAEDSDYLSHSEDLQDESVNIRKPPSGRDARTKRSRTIHGEIKYFDEPGKESAVAMDSCRLHAVRLGFNYQSFSDRGQSKRYKNAPLQHVGVVCWRAALIGDILGYGRSRCAETPSSSWFSLLLELKMGASESVTMLEKNVRLRPMPSAICDRGRREERKRRGDLEEGSPHSELVGLLLGIGPLGPKNIIQTKFLSFFSIH